MSYGTTGLVLEVTCSFFSWLWDLGWCSLCHVYSSSGLLVTVPQSQCLLKSRGRAIVPRVLVGRTEFLSCAVSPRRPCKTISCPEDAKSLERQSLVEGLQMVLPTEAGGREAHWPGVNARAGWRGKAWPLKLKTRSLQLCKSAFLILFNVFGFFLYYSLPPFGKDNKIPRCWQMFSDLQK